jgi:hypothetical protein
MVDLEDGLEEFRTKRQRPILKQNQIIFMALLRKNTQKMQNFGLTSMLKNLVLWDVTPC